MIDLAGYSFPPHKACIVCRHIMDGSPILAVAHDEDGDLQFTCGEDAHVADDWHAIGLEHLDCGEEGLANLPAVHPGYAALRNDVQSQWQVVPIE